MKKKLKGIVCVLGLALLSCLTLNAQQKTSRLILNAADANEKDVIAVSADQDWYHNEKTNEQGSWTINDTSVQVDAFNGNYAMEGANLLTKQGTALGAYEFTTKITINEMNKVQNPMVGIIPWYLDEDNYLYVQLKFTDQSNYLLSAAEKAEGYGIEQIICSGKYDGMAKYYTATAQQENTVFDALTVTALKDAKLAPTAAEGHTLTVRLENNSATATSYKISIAYNGVDIGSTYAYYYNAVAKNLSVGFMAQDVKATFTDAKINDFYATNNTAALARDFKEQNGFTYRVLNGVDVWTFNQDESISFVTDSINAEGSTKVASNYKVSGSNIAGYDTNRGFTENPYKETENGLPQNYEIQASFQMSNLPEYKGTKIVQGYGLLAWYKDDQNFVDVTIRRTVSGLKTAPTYVYEVVLYGWIACSSAPVGENIYTIETDFDPTEAHSLKVQKKSTGFYVYLDDMTQPIISKNVKGTNINYYYGYEGYNAQFKASKIESKAIYASYDEISVMDEKQNSWRVSGSEQSSWKFENGNISLKAKETGTLTHRSYLIGQSDISDKNMSIIVNASIELGAASYSEIMLAPYIVDDNNYAQIGIAWKNNQPYARIRTSTYTDDDIDEDRDPQVTLREMKLDGIDIHNPITIKAEKIDQTLTLYINDDLVYGRQIKDINVVSEDYGIYVYNMDITIHSLTTDGYKKYEQTQVGDWITSGMKYNEWTITDEGYLAGDATYTSDMTKDEDDGDKNFALKENTLRDNYEMTVDIKATAQSEAEDRVGVVMWYLDEDNFMLFYMDRWRADSSVPRTTIYGKIDGETLPTTYNHGGWLAEGDAALENGMTQTEASQVTNWHTVKVQKEGNTFTCYIDNESNGYISYTLEAGLPSIDGKMVYSGVYSYNDAVLIRSYDVTPINGFSSATLPCEPDHPYNASVTAPELPIYQSVIYEDEFDGAINNVKDGGNDQTPDDSGNVSETPSPSDSTDSSGTSTTQKKGCKGNIHATSVSFVGLLIVGLGCIAYKRKEQNS